jgi:hypothetical protein
MKKYHLGNGLPPAISEKRKGLYNQDHLRVYRPTLPGFPVDEQPINNKPNLIYLWEIIRNRIINLYLAIPTNYILYLTTEVIDVPNPITTIKPNKVEDILNESQQKLDEIRYPGINL